MFRRKLIPFWIGFLVALAPLSASLAATQSHVPDISQQTIEAIQLLPYGVPGQESLIIDKKHIEKSIFFGNALESEFGFLNESSLNPDGLWLRLKNRGSGSWASAVVRLSSPTSITDYNSLVMWVRPEGATHRLWIGLQDPYWTRKGSTRVRTPLFPQRGFAKDDIYQVVLPFSVFSNPEEMVWTDLSQITFEFGTESVGNSQIGHIEILGLAFVKQNKPLDKMRFYKAIVSAHPPAPIAAQAEPVVTPPLAKPALKAESKPKFSWDFLIWFLPPLILVLLASIFWRRKKMPKPLKHNLTQEKSYKMLQEIQWPHGKSEYKNGDFWKRLRSTGIQNAWLSPFNFEFNKNESKGAYYGEERLRTEIDQAEKYGLTLIPSLCFVRTIFDYEIFLTNPHLYLIKPLLESEEHYSDEELRSRHVGFFSVRIPPYWQRIHHLDERVLVAYGKMPGAMPSNDSAQFNLTSPLLRDYAIGVLKRIASVSKGVHIEGAAALLNSSLKRYWHTASDNLGEFWKDIIPKIKSVNPEFLFIADRAGSDVKKMKEVGFDYFENNSLVNTLINQIRLQEVGALQFYLTGENSFRLKDSIFNISPLIESKEGRPISRQQNLLSAVILSLLPGIIQHNGKVGKGFGQFLRNISEIHAFSEGQFVFLRSNQSSVLSFARWDGNLLYMAAANFSLETREVQVRMDPFVDKFKNETMYLLSDVFFGSSYIRDIPTPSSGMPANALVGKDVKELGIPLSLPGLSLRLLSVNLTSPVSYESVSQIRKLY